MVSPQTDSPDEFPIAVAPVSPLVRASAEIESEPLWRGAVVVTDSTELTSEGQGEIKRRWLPDPRLVLETRTRHVAGSGEIPFQPLGVALHEGEVSGPLAIGMSTRYGTGVRRTFLVETASLGDIARPIDEVVFQVVNFPRFVGEPVRSGGDMWAGRLTLTAEPWEVRLDCVPHTIDDLEHQTRGYAVTHFGRLARRDRTAITLPEAEKPMLALGWLLSLLRGAYSQPVAWSGLTGGEVVWTRHVDWSLDPWTSEEGVFPAHALGADESDVIPALERAFGNALAICGDAIRGDRLGQILLWYLSANNGHNAGDLLLAGAGLLLLAYDVLVVPGLMSDQEFDDSAAGLVVDTMLTELHVDRIIPDSLEPLRVWASRNNVGAAEAVMRFRNYLTHPPARRRPAGSNNRELQHDARELALSLLERALLSYVGYTSIVRDRLDGWFVRPLGDDTHRKSVQEQNCTQPTP
jgi:hypothetical protein